MRQARVVPRVAQSELSKGPHLAARLGVSASVQSGNLVCGGNSQSVQSKQGVTPGRITRAWPLKPSVPPSTTGFTVARSGLPSASYSAATTQNQTILEAKFNGCVALEALRAAVDHRRHSRQVQLALPSYLQQQAQPMSPCRHLLLLLSRPPSPASASHSSAGEQRTDMPNNWNGGAVKHQ